VLDVSGFEQAKISLAVHDFIDHLWSFDLIDKLGLFRKYADMFDSIGNPELTDIFKREGEAVAAISFGIRLFESMPSTFVPLIELPDIQRIFEEMFDNGLLLDRHLTAFQVVRKLKRGSIEGQSLEFGVSSYLTELDEQRRKHGKIKQRDPRTRVMIGEFDPLSADYLSFMVEAHHEMVDSKNGHKQDLLRFHILLEQFLSSVCKGEVDSNSSLSVSLDDLSKLDYSKVTIPPARIRWMYHNYGFSSTRSSVIR
jgi:hypothetical protein